MSEKLLVGILGAGWAAESDAVAYRQLSNVTVSGLWNHSRARVEALARSLQQPDLRIYADWQELIAQSKVDVIYRFYPGNPAGRCGPSQGSPPADPVGRFTQRGNYCCG